jgi:hypothetical protein
LAALKARSGCRLLSVDDRIFPCTRLGRPQRVVAFGASRSGAFAAEYAPAMRTALVVLALVAALAAVAHAAASKRFASKRYSYSLVLPAGWTSYPASTNWQGGPPFQGQSEVDTYLATDGSAMAIAARSVPRTTTLRQWATVYVGVAVPGECTRSPGYRATMLGGIPALVFAGRCDVHDIRVELAVRRGRGYVFALASTRASSETADRATIEAARRSFRFVR